MKKTVGYIYNPEIVNHQFAKDHPMKTKRVAMAHSLIQNYELYHDLDHVIAKSAERKQLQKFHDPGYLSYLSHWVTGKGQDIVKVLGEDERKRTRQDFKPKPMYNVNEGYDCPSFDGLYDFCQLAVGGSIDAADIIITGYSDIAINWSGGFHHAKKTGASGFCYVNDIVICILQLLEQYPRVLYLDIDVHHGDGVEEAFYHTNRVMTVSFHQYEEGFFPCTGGINEVGEGIGKYYSVNVPLKKGMDDLTYYHLFKKVLDVVMGSYRPDVIVMQCGADSLAKDKLGNFNMSIKGHSECVKHMMSYSTPLILLGGGGYTIENVSRCWAYETAVVLGQEIDPKIPLGDAFRDLYKDDNYRLHFDIEVKNNENSADYIDDLVKRVSENMRVCEARPSVQLHNSKEYLPTLDPQIEWNMAGEDENSLDDDIDVSPSKNRRTFK